MPFPNSPRIGSGVTLSAGFPARSVYEGKQGQEEGTGIEKGNRRRESKKGIEEGNRRQQLQQQQEQQVQVHVQVQVQVHVPTTTTTLPKLAQISDTTLHSMKNCTGEEQRNANIDK